MADAAVRRLRQQPPAAVTLRQGTVEPRILAAENIQSAAECIRNLVRTLQRPVHSAERMAKGSEMLHVDIVGGQKQVTGQMVHEYRKADFRWLPTCFPVPWFSL